MSGIGEAIDKARSDHGMTWRGLARATNLSPTFVCEIGRGTRMPSPETVLLVANVFPEQDSAEWLWLLLADLWGESIVDVMKRHALAEQSAPTTEPHP